MAASPAPPPPPSSTLSGVWRRLRADRTSLLALALLLLLVLVALFARLLAPYDPNALFGAVEWKNRPPSAAHPFGTDPYSRDVLSRLIFGTRVALGVGVLAGVFSTTLGAAYGAVAGFAGGLVDGAMMRLVDAALGVPRVLLLLAVVALWGHVSTPALVVLLGVTGWLGTSRAAARMMSSGRFCGASRAPKPITTFASAGRYHAGTAAFG